MGDTEVAGPQQQALRVFQAACPIGEFWFDEAAAERAVRFFEARLTHTKGEWAGTPLKLSSWQADRIIRPLFGWKRADATRKYRTAYIQIPRKAGKSTVAAGIALYLLIAENEPGAEVYSAAADRDQAAIVFEMAKGLAEASEPLRKRVKPFKRALTVPSTASSYKVLSSEAYTKHDLSAHGIVVDEVHALPDRELWDVPTTSTGARRQPLTVAITTAGFDRHSLCSSCTTTPARCGTAFSRIRPDAPPGNVIDYDTIRARINELAERYHIKEIAIDRWNATQLATQLTGDGFEIIGFGQGFASMSAPCKELEKRVLGREINHGNHAVMRWMASNVSVTMDAAGNMKADKAK